ncbi:MAG: AraC family transcriptional regulator [Phycisphaeraceae bacterium]
MATVQTLTSSDISCDLRPIRVLAVRNIRADELHDHDYLEIQMITAGRATHVTANGSEMVRAGDILIIRPGAWHEYAATRNLAAYVLCIRHDALRNDLGWLISDARAFRLLWCPARVPGSLGITRLSLNRRERLRLIPFLNQLAALGEADWNVTRLEQLGLFLIILDGLLKIFDDEHDLKAGSVPQLIDQFHPAIERSLRALDSRPAEPWRVSDLARQAGIDPAYLSRLFTQQIGLAPMTYLARIRAERAARLLLTTNRTIQQIACEVGWDDPTYFARRFKHHFGISAKLYRQRAR